MFIIGDAIDDVTKLSDESLIVHDTEKGYMIYDRPRPENQITGSQWKEYADILKKHINDKK